MGPRYRTDRGRVDPEKLEKGPHGRALCRQCKIEVPRGRYTFCSDDCVHNWKLTTNGVYLRQVLFRRDRGICAVCGLDTEKLKALLVAVWLRDPERAFQNAYVIGFGSCFKAMRWWRRQPRPKSLWEADHVKPVVEGGGMCGLDNLRTLCKPCHKKATADLRARLKHRK